MADAKQIMMLLDGNTTQCHTKLGARKGEGGKISYDHDYLNSDEYKAQVLMNQMTMMQGVKILLEKPA